MTCTHRRPFAIGLAVLALAGVTACGGDDSTADTTGGGPATSGATATTTAGTAAVAPATARPGTTSASAAPASSAAGGSTTPATDGTVPTDVEPYIEAGAAEIGGDPEAAHCLSAAVINALGADAVLGTGMTPDEFFNSASLADAGITITPQIQEDVQTNALGCGDLVEFIAATIDDETQQTCLRQTFTNELLAERLAVAVVGATPSTELTAAQDLLRQCAGE